MLDEIIGAPSTSNCTLTRCTMGYTMVTKIDGKEYRYTEWVDYGTKAKFTPDWERNVGTELYDHSIDPGENANHAGEAQYAAVQAMLSKTVAGGATDWWGLGSVGRRVNGLDACGVCVRLYAKGPFNYRCTSATSQCTCCTSAPPDAGAAQSGLKKPAVEHIVVALQQFNERSGLRSGVLVYPKCINLLKQRAHQRHELALQGHAMHWPHDPKSHCG